jgi:hypothetical protein
MDIVSFYQNWTENNVYFEVYPSDLDDDIVRSFVSSFKADAVTKNFSQNSFDELENHLGCDLLQAFYDKVVELGDQKVAYLASKDD